MELNKKWNLFYFQAIHTQMIGELFFFTNELNLQNVIRTYKVQNQLIKTVRAWHGHKLEET